jgi:hypothetical protein
MGLSGLLLESDNKDLHCIRFQRIRMMGRIFRPKDVKKQQDRERYVIGRFTIITLQQFCYSDQ